VRAVALRHGAGPVVHVFGGAGGSEVEIAEVAASFQGDPTVIAHVPAEGAAAAGSVAAMAADAAAYLREAQPSGPYRLLGYSFGGLLALEASQILRDAGEEVVFVGIVDTFFDQGFWPTSLFVRATARRAAVHAAALRRHSPVEAARDVRRRVARLRMRLQRRYAPEGSDSPATSSVQDANVDVMRRWQPRALSGTVTLFTAAETDLGCDLAELWRPWIGDLVVRRIPGNHLSVVQTKDGVRRLAREVDEAMQPRPIKVLVVTAFRWPGAARLAVDLHEVGCTVDAVAPPGSAVHDVRAIDRTHTIGRLAPVRSLRRAIEASRADLVVPFDDRVRQSLGLLHARSDPNTVEGLRMREFLDRSLGCHSRFPHLYSRTALMEIAAAAGVLCPETSEVRSSHDVSAWLRAHDGDAVLKTDGSWGGRGVAIVHNEREGRRAWREMSRRPSVLRALKRLLVERDPWPLRAHFARTLPVVSIQPFIEGQPANAAVACRAGTTLGQVQAAVIESDGPKGPSTVVRIVDNADMTYAVKSVVCSFELSGLIGLDFVIDACGRAHLLELNPRATPTAHLIGADGADPLTSLRAVFGRELPLPRRSGHPGDVVALFPQEQVRDSQSLHLHTAFHDVPHHAPDLVARVMADLARQERSFLPRRVQPPVGLRNVLRGVRTHFWRPSC
jgi:thioesterase domain-containing protein